MQFILSKNQKISYKYNIIGKLECGIILKGHEVRAIKSKNVNICHAYIVFRKMEMFLIGIKIKSIPTASDLANRPIKIIAHKKEILKIHNKYIEKGISIVPAKIIQKNNFIKVIISWVKVKKDFAHKNIMQDSSIKLKISRIVKRSIYRSTQCKSIN